VHQHADQTSCKRASATDSLLRSGADQSHILIFRTDRRLCRNGLAEWLLWGAGVQQRLLVNKSLPIHKSISPKAAIDYAYRVSLNHHRIDLEARLVFSGDNTQLAKSVSKNTRILNSMATATKKTAPKAAATPKKLTKVAAPAKTPAKRASVSKTVQAIAKITANIAKLTERKDKLNAEITLLRDQRTALKAAPAAAPVAAKAAAKAAPKAAAPKAAAPKKAAKPAARK
jgi:hypothetical protein